MHDTLVNIELVARILDEGAQAPWHAVTLVKAHPHDGGYCVHGHIDTRCGLRVRTSDQLTTQEAPEQATCPGCMAGGGGGDLFEEINAFLRVERMAGVGGK